MPAELKQVPAEEPIEIVKVEEYQYKAKITEIALDKPDKLKKELRFKIEYYSDMEETNWSGVFTFKRGDLGSFGRQKVIEAQLNDGTFPTSGASFLHMTVAFLQTHLIQAPDWWKPLNFQVEDFKLIEDVYTYTNRWEGSFRRPSLGKEQ